MSKIYLFSRIVIKGNKTNTIMNLDTGTKQNDKQNKKHRKLKKKQGGAD